MSDIYNPKFKTKQIFNLSANVTGNPSDDEIYFWVTFENSKLYANYRLPGEENDRKYHITDPISFNPEQNFSNKVNSVSFDATNFLIRYFNDNGSVGVPLENILIDDEIVFNENSITFPVSQNKTRVVNVPNVLKKHIVSGSFSNKTLYLNYNTNEQISIDMSNVSSNMSYNDSNSIDLNVSGNSLSANVKISNDQNNQLQIKNDGLFVSTPSINGNGISALLFDVPTINNNQVFHFKIQFSNDKTFSNELNIRYFSISNWF